MSAAQIVGFDPWLADPPACDAFMSGGICEIEIVPAPRWPIEHRNVRALHGMICELLRPAGFEHHATMPHFSLLPSASRSGWSVYLDTPDAVAAVAQQSHAATLYERLSVARFGAVQRVRAPLVRERRRHVVHVEALTPVIVRRTLRKADSMGGHKFAIHECPTSENIGHALTVSYLSRLGLPPTIRESVRVELVARDTRTARVPMGGKYGGLLGWVGSIVLAVNAPGLWLLKAAETTGLGGRTSFGFGRIAVHT